MNELEGHVCVMIYSNSHMWAVCDTCGRKSTDEQIEAGTMVHDE